MVAVIIPAYERGDQLAEALDSLVCQTFHRFVTIVVDDASPSTNIKDTVEQYKSKLTGLCYMRAASNGGPGTARQLGIKAARAMNCEYVMFMDEDDKLFPMSVKLLFDAISVNQADMVSSQIHVEGQYDKFHIIEEDNYIWMHGKIFRLSFLNDNDIFFDPAIRLNEDVFFFKKILMLPQKSWKYHSIDCPTYLWRNNSQSITRADNGDLFTKECIISYIQGIDITIDWCIQHNYDYTPLSQMLSALYKYEQHLKIIAPELGPEQSVLIDKICAYPGFQQAYTNATSNCLYFIERTPRFLKYHNKYYEFDETPLQWAQRHNLNFAIFKKM